MVSPRGLDLNALVLGGAGFLGSWIVDSLLERGHNALVLGHARGELDKRAVFIAGDFRDRATLRRALAQSDGVICVGAYYPRFSIHRREQAKYALSELRPILEVVRESRITKFVFTSSPSVMCVDPRAQRFSTYHFIKKLLHDEVVQAIDQGLPGCIALPGACFGPGDRKPTTGQAVLEIVSGRLRFYLDGQMNAVDARDVARAEVIMLERATAGSSYQLGGWNGSGAEFAQRVAAIANVPPPRQRVPYLSAKIAAIVCETIQHAAGAPKPWLPQSGVDLIHFGTHLDSAAAVRDLDFAARPFDDTICDTLSWFRAHDYFR